MTVVSFPRSKPCHHQLLLRPCKSTPSLPRRAATASSTLPSRLRQTSSSALTLIAEPRQAAAGPPRRTAAAAGPPRRAATTAGPPPPRLACRCLPQPAAGPSPPHPAEPTSRAGSPCRLRGEGGGERERGGEDK
ncbi:hypothetical protein EE612_060170, partial [Oryza sativa]